MAKTKMATEQVEVPAVEGPSALEFKVVSLKQTQAVIDLESGDETDIEVKSNRYEIPKFNDKVFGSESEYKAAVLAAAMNLISDPYDVAEAIVLRATSQSYQAGKAAALAGGNYLTAELRGKIVSIMRMNAQFADLKAADCYKKWLGAYKAEGGPKPAALQFLNMAQAMTDSQEVDL